jgi:hypothetical protein
MLHRPSYNGTVPRAQRSSNPDRHAAGETPLLDIFAVLELVRQQPGLDRLTRFDVTKARVSRFPGLFDWR